MLCLAIALSGIYIADRARKRAEKLRLISLFFSECIRLCRTDRYSALELLRELSSDRRLACLEFLEPAVAEMDEGENLKMLWCRGVSACAEALPDRESLSLLLQFSSALGRPSREEFLECCDSLHTAFNEKAHMERQKWEKSREAVVCSGVLAAAAIFFIFM